MLYFFAGKFLLLNSIKISSLHPFLMSFNIELKNIFACWFVSAFFSKHSAITETHAKEYAKFNQFLILSFYLFISYFDLYFLDMPFLDIIPRSSHWRCSTKKGVLKNLAIFTEKHLCWSLFLIKMQAFMCFTVVTVELN